MNQTFLRVPKISFLGHFVDFLGSPDPTEIFFKNRASLSGLLHDFLTSLKKSKKSDEPILRSYIAEGQTDKRTNGGKFTGSWRQRGSPKIHLKHTYDFSTKQLPFLKIKEIKQLKSRYHWSVKSKDLKKSSLMQHVKKRKKKRTGEQ